MREREGALVSQRGVRGGREEQGKGTIRSDETRRRRTKLAPLQYSHMTAPESPIAVLFLLPLFSVSICSSDSHLARVSLS